MANKQVKLQPLLKAASIHLSKPVLLAILVVASTIGVYVAFVAHASGIPNIVSIATSQIGTGEINGNNGGPSCKYQGSGCPQAWCADFVSWVYQQAGYPFTGGADGGWRISYSGNMKPWFQAHGNWYPRGSADIPQPGDVLYSVNSYSGHVGIVDHVTGSTLYTIDGNWSNAVNRVSYPNYRSNGTIVGWGRLKGVAPGPTPQPPSPTPPPPSPTPSPVPAPPPPVSSNPYPCASPHPLVKQGSSGSCVQYLQWILINKFGYGSIINPAGGTDGSFGPATNKAVVDFQSKHGLSADGQVGPLTWGALER